MSEFGLQYVEGNHTMSWHSSPESGSVATFKLSEEEIREWNEPFASETITSNKKREIFKAVVSALSYLQVVEQRGHSFKQPSE